MQYIDQHGRRITLSGKIGSGGEGTVYEIAGSDDLVAKIYHQPVDAEKAVKLAAMSRLATTEILKFAAWPEATLHQSNGTAVAGIILPRIKNPREIHELYSPAHRKVRFPHADWRFLIRVARNCAAAFATLHDHGIVIGDVNQGNVIVSQQATVGLIDCDSFQVSANGRVYRCPVGVAHFLPPELQDARLSSVIRTVNHDNFGLAILIFHLLFMGRHPFSGRYSGNGDMPIEKAIRGFRFAYSSSAKRLQMAPPPDSLTLDELPLEISVLFERALSSGSENINARPTALEWGESLAELERRLCQCNDDPGHYYSTHLRKCPWCELVQSGAPNFFISVTIQAVIARSASFDLAGIWAQIESIPRPDQAFTPSPRLSTSRIVPRPVPASIDENRPIRNLVGIISGASGLLSILGILLPTVAYFTLPLCIVFAIWWIVLKTNSPLVELKRERRKLHRNKTLELGRAQANQRSVAQRYQQQFRVKLDGLHQLKLSYDKLKAQRDSELRILHQHVQQRQFEEYLRSCFISNARVDGIGPERMAALESYGIETAYDVDKWRVLSVPGFGEKMTERLLHWRWQMEQGFRFNPSMGVPKIHLQNLEMKYAQIRARCERLLQHGPYELRQISNASNADVARLDAVVARLEYERAQTRADVRVFDKIPWWY